MLKAVIFDLDGVLIDSVPYAYQVRTELLAENGIDIRQVPDPFNEYHKGSSLRDLLNAVQLYNGARLDFKTLAEQQTTRVLQALRDNHITADPALLTFIHDLKAHDVTLAVATAGVKDTVLRKLTQIGLNDIFMTVVTADDVQQHKPDPASYNLALSRLGLPAGECIAFEDSSAGVTSAHSAGIPVIGFVGLSDSKQALSNTIATISSWDQVSFESLNTLVGG